MQRRSKIRKRWLSGAGFLLLALATCVYGQDSPSQAAGASDSAAPPSSAPVQPAPDSTQAQPSKIVEEAKEAAAPSVFSLHNGVSIELSTEWQKITPEGAAPPASLGPYAPPFRFSDEIMLADDEQKSILKIATSNNPLLGHDSYWLDSQLHSGAGSSMSLTDVLFYLFLPPSRSCLNHTLEVYNEASRSSQTGDPASQSDLQVSYSCDYSKTLSDFYASQLSSAVTYEQAADGPRAHPVLADFQLAPMEQMDVSGMTWFVFEAQAVQEITADDAARFGLSRDLQGEHVDFFWAIGAESPYPFMPDDTRKDAPIIQLAFAGVAPGPNPNKRPEFLDILHHIRTDKPTVP